MSRMKQIMALRQYETPAEADTANATFRAVAERALVELQEHDEGPARYTSFTVGSRTTVVGAPYGGPRTIVVVQGYRPQDLSTIRIMTKGERQLLRAALDEADATLARR